MLSLLQLNPLAKYTFASNTEMESYIYARPFLDQTYYVKCTVHLEKVMQSEQYATVKSLNELLIKN